MTRFIFQFIFLIGLVNLFNFTLFAQSRVSTKQTDAPQIEKIEPPSWWTNQSVNPIRVLVRGKNLKYVDAVKSLNKSLKVSNVKTNKNGDYIFFDLTIPKGAKFGKYDFEISSQDGKATFQFEISAPLDSKTNFQGVTNDDIIYLIMTDRFSDGDTSNNKDADRTNPRAWHGGDFRGVINHLDYLKELGVTTIWLTPWYDNSDDVTNCDKPWCPNTSYHGYGAIDYYAVENHFGTMKDLQELVQTAHAKGLKVIQDQVANHIGFKHSWAKNAPLDDWFPPFKQNTFNNSILLSPNASQSERDNLLHGWFDFSLPDMNQDEPEVARYEIQNALWWIAATGIDGIRQDTIQYMSREFIRAWSGAILKQYPKFYMVGEVFEEDSVQTAFFQGGKTGWDGVDTKLPSVFDFKLWRTSQEVFTGKKPIRSIRDVLKYDGLYPNVNNITVLQNNHDTKRFMSLDGATVEGAMLHTAFVLSARGIPQLYYGEELAMKGGDDPFNRADFVGGFPEDSADKFAKAGRTAGEQKMFEWTREWTKLRRENLAVKKGKTIDLFYDNDTYVFARERQLADWSVWNLIAFNRSENEKEVSFDSVFAKKFLGQEFKLNLLIGSNIKTIWQENKIKIVLPPKSAVAFSVSP
jgi:glycosidase